MSLPFPYQGPHDQNLQHDVRGAILRYLAVAKAFDQIENKMMTIIMMIVMATMMVIMMMVVMMMAMAMAMTY